MIMNKDTVVTFQEIKEALNKFRDDRAWKGYHTPKNLGAGLSVEASELLELFVWQTDEAILERFKNDDFYASCIKDELADVINMALCLANIFDIDIASSIQAKISKNEKKYPIQESLSDKNADKYLELKLNKKIQK